MKFWKRRLIALLSSAVMLVALTSPALADSTHVHNHNHHNDVEDSFNTDNSQDNDTIVGNNNGNNNDSSTDTDTVVDTAANVCTAGGFIGRDSCNLDDDGDITVEG